MTDIQQLTQAILQFRDERDWAQFHSGKDLATLLNVEAGELLELFLWKQHDEAVDLWTNSKTNWPMWSTRPYSWQPIMNWMLKRSSYKSWTRIERSILSRNQKDERRNMMNYKYKLSAIWPAAK
jgi:hypothetical protein